MNNSLFFLGMLALPVIASAQVDLNLGLKAHYPLDGHALDVSGNDHHGVIYGDPTAVEDRFGIQGHALEFDGIDDFIETTSTFDFQERTVSVWANPHHLWGSGSTTNVVFVQDANSLDFGYMLATFGNGKIWMSAGGVSSRYDHAVNSTNLWYHLVLIRYADSTKYYINGELVSSNLVPDGTASSINPHDKLLIGVGRTMYQQFFDGYIDDLRIYDRALTTDEVNSLSGVSSAPGDDVTLLVYPVPNHGSFHIKLSGYATPLKYNVRVVDVLGRLIYREHDIVDEEHAIELPDMASGMYSVMIDGTCGAHTVPIIVVN